MAVSDVLNDLDRASTGRLMLPNLVVDMPLFVVVRLKLPPLAAGTKLLEVRLAWDAPKDGGRRVLHATLGHLPALPFADWSTVPDDPEVCTQVALLMAARAQKEAALAAERGDMQTTKQFLCLAREAASSVPSSAETQLELEALSHLENALDSGQHQQFIKGSKFRAYSRRQSRPSKPNEPPAKEE